MRKVYKFNHDIRLELYTAGLSVAKAAEKLGFNPTTLLRRLLCAEFTDHEKKIVRQMIKEHKEESMPKNHYKPNIAIPPGETIDECVTFLAATKLGLNVAEYEDLIAGLLPINEQLAEKLGAYFSTPKDFWLNLEANYRELLAAGRKSKWKP